MRRRELIGWMLSVVLLGLMVPGAGASDEPVRSFSACVAHGGHVRFVGDDLTCRLVRSYDFRVYGTVTTDCGEEVQLEIWGETRSGVVTYVLEPGRTIELPEIGQESMLLPEEPLPCLDD